MISRLEVELEQNKNYNLTYQNGSLFQGVIMENLNRVYGEELHISGLKPYSQYVNANKNNLSWIVNSLDNESKEEIINTLEKLESIYLKKKDITFLVKNIKKIEIEYDLFIDKFLLEECPRNLQIKFVTPTAFKSNGKYIFHPSKKHIIESIMKKFDSFSPKVKLYDEEVVEEIEKSIEVTAYNLKSTFFYLEKTKIPSFIGSVNIKINGPKQLVSIVNIILNFGCFSGVGIKTAIGMGAMEVREVNSWKK